MSFLPLSTQKNQTNPKNPTDKPNRNTQNPNKQQSFVEGREEHRTQYSGFGPSLASSFVAGEKNGFWLMVWKH